MDKREAIKIAENYLQLIEANYAVKKAMLFGSFANGTNHVDSDIDIAIVLQSDTDIIDTQIDLMKLRRNVDLRIEPHPFFENDFTLSNPVVNEIMKFGIDLKFVNNHLPKA